jgi:YfiH family protein
MSQLALSLIEKSSSLIRPNWPNLPAHVHAFTTTRKGGASTGAYGDENGGAGFNLATHVGDDLQAVLANRIKLNQALPQDVIYLSQIHGSIVVDAGLRRKDCEADACFTAELDMPCAVLTADCLPVLFCDLEGTVVAAAHAGWRGLAKGVLLQTLQQMRMYTGTEISAWMGPAIGAHEFEVGAEVKREFERVMGNVDAHFVPSTKLISKSSNQSQVHEGKYLANIYGLARQQLRHLGVKQIYGGEYCTVTQSELFYSYRRDGVTGRMASLIWMSAQ